MCRWIWKGQEVDMFVMFVSFLRRMFSEFLCYCFDLEYLHSPFKVTEREWQEAVLYHPRGGGVDLGNFGKALALVLARTLGFVGIALVLLLLFLLMTGEPLVKFIMLLILAFILFPSGKRKVA